MKSCRQPAVQAFLNITISNSSKFWDVTIVINQIIELFCEEARNIWIQVRKSFSSVSSPLPLMSWGHTLRPNILISICSLMMTSGGAWTSSNCTGAVPRHRLLHNLNMQSRHLHLCPQSLFVKHTGDRSCAQCLLWPVDAVIRNWCKEKYQERWSMAAGLESSFYLAHLLASMQWHRCRARVCRNVVCAAEEANCKSSILQK